MASRNEIMSDANGIVRDRQLVIRRELDRRGISLKAVSYDSGIPYSTIVSYFPGEKDKVPNTMSAAAVYGLCGALPADLLSLLLPDGFQIVRVPEAIDHDAISDWADDYCARKLAAHRKDSECEELIGPNEDAELRGAVVAFPGARAA